jgi:ribose 5-phosphate isomerase B
MKPSFIIGADHAGFAFKEKLVHELCKRGYIVEDISPAFVDGDDYPPIGKEVASLVAKKKDGRGILVCASGIGMSIAANRVSGARAIVGHDVAEVKKAREHNAINILCLNGLKTKQSEAIKMIETFVTTPTEKFARRTRRIKQLD